MRWRDTQRGGPPRQGPPRHKADTQPVAPAVILRGLDAGRDRARLAARERWWAARRGRHAARLAHELMPLTALYRSSVPPHLREPDGLAERVARLEREVAELRQLLEGGGTR